MRAARVCGGWNSKILSLVMVLALASATSAAVVTFSLSLNDDGTGSVCGGGGTGLFAVYADVSPGDNFGLFAFGVDLKDGPIDSIMNMAPQGQFRKTGSATKFVGFGAGVTEDAAGGKISGLPDLAKLTNLIPAYGFGQSGGDLNNLKPAGYGNYFDANPNGPGSLYSSHLLLAVGTYHGLASAMGFDTASVDNKASVYSANGGSTASTVAQVVLRFVSLTPVCEPDSLTVTGTAQHANQAVGGSIVVSGANHLYSSEVDQLIDPSAATGSAPVQTIGDEAGNLYVMAKVSGDAAAVSQVLAEFNNASIDPEAPRLHALYDSQFGPGGFNLLYITPNFAGPKVVNWDFSFNPGAVIDQLAVVPEPEILVTGVVVTLLSLCRRRRAIVEGR